MNFLQVPLALDEEDQFRVKLKKISKQTGVEIPNNSYYQTGFCKCWKCKQEILVFSWHEKSNWDGNEPTLWETISKVCSSINVKPIPRTIQYRYSKGYWFNTCPYCNSVQDEAYSE